ncbi:MAG: dicarboxylate/amino acid:cation symporter [Thermoguttaceae bacterium]|nr:dicarboxylate/amino acid:cation symporter [Thermoguttaceae bacterium]
MTKPEKKIGLTTKIFLGLSLGLLVGVLFKLYVPGGYVRDVVFVDGLFYVLGQGFVRLMKLLVVPLVFFSIACGASAVGDASSLGKVGGKTLAFYLATTAIAVSVALTVGSLIGPGRGLDMTALETRELAENVAPTVKETLLNIVPENPVASLAGGVMLQVIFFALLVGILIAKMGERASAIATFNAQCNDLMMEMTSLIMRFAPIGVFCLIARTFANLGFDAFLPLLKYMLAVCLALFVQCVLVYQAMLLGLTRLNPIRFLRKFFPVMAFAFSTSTSNATIPMNIDCLVKKIGVSRKLASFAIPLGATINMDGTSIMQGVAVMFAAQAYGVHLELTQYLTVIATATLASIGTAGIPSVGLVTLSMVFMSVGLPVEAIGLIIGVDRILDMLRTAVNITGDAVCATIVAKQNGDFDADVFWDR